MDFCMLGTNHVLHKNILNWMMQDLHLEKSGKQPERR